MEQKVSSKIKWKYEISWCIIVASENGFGWFYKKRNFKRHRCGKNLKVVVRYIGWKETVCPRDIESGQWLEATPMILDNPPYMYFSGFGWMSTVAFKLSNLFPDIFLGLCWVLPWTIPFPGPSRVTHPHPIWFFPQIFSG